MAEVKLCVFCGSRFGAAPGFAQIADEVGRGMAARNISLVYGGGDVGLMGTVATATMNAGGKVYGFIPERLMDREVGKKDISSLEITTDMFDRKRAMIEQSDAFLALPGGLGTLDEILDAITLAQLGYHQKPVILMGEQGFWQPFAALIDHVIAHGFANPSAAKFFEIISEPDELWPRLC